MLKNMKLKHTSALGLSLLVAGLLSLPANASDYIVVPNAEQKPSTQHDPSAQALMETVFSGYWFGETSKFDAVHYEVLDRRVSWGKQGRAYLRVRYVSPDHHDAAEIAKKLCKEQPKPIEWQLAFVWDRDANAWRNTHENGATGSNPCLDSQLWSPREVDLILNPPLPPTPPEITRKDIKKPPPGSSERKEILEALRPAFEEFVGPPVKFVVINIKVAAGFAFLTVHGQRPSGKEFEAESWKGCEYGPEGSSSDAWVRKRNGKWELA